MMLLRLARYFRFFAAMKAQHLTPPADIAIFAPDYAIDAHTLYCYAAYICHHFVDAAVRHRATMSAAMPRCRGFTTRHHA